MNTVEVHGYINKYGELEVKLPDGLPSGDVQVRIMYEPQQTPSQSVTWTDEELDALLKIEPLTGTEIVAAGLLGGWENKGIADSNTWVQEQRRKRHEIRKLG